MDKATRSYSKIQEKRVAKSLGGKIQPGSGSLNITSLKGDVKVDDTDNWKVLVSCKTKAVDKMSVGARSMSIKKEWMVEVQQQTREQGKDLGVLAFSFDNKQDYYVLTSQDFENLLQTVIEHENLLKEMKL